MDTAARETETGIESEYSPNIAKKYHSSGQAHQYITHEVLSLRKCND